MSEAKFYDVICPYCCHKFHPNDAHFRIPETRFFEKAIDPFLLDYNLTIRQLNEDEAEQVSIQYPYVKLDDPIVSYDDGEIEKNGFIQNITVNHNAKPIGTDIRLCPNCHNILAKGAGLRETVLISIIGDARVGKSIYLTILINELSNNSDYYSRLTYTGDRDSKKWFYEKYEKPLLIDRVLIDPTERKKIPPFGYNYWYQYRGEDGRINENVVDLVFYDMAGEDLRDSESMRKNGFNIKDSSGIIYLIDPTNFSGISDFFRLKDRRLIDVVPIENSSKNIFSAMFNYFLGQDTEKSKIPLALTVSKSDLFTELDFSYFKNRPYSRIKQIDDSEKHSGYLDLQACYCLNAEVREMLSCFGEDHITNSLNSNFKNVSCFAVSSLGGNPVLKSKTDPETGAVSENIYVNGDIVPFRVKDPFYWILAKNRLMYNYENEKYFRDSDKPEPTKKKSLISKISDFFKNLFSKKEK